MFQFLRAPHSQFAQEGHHRAPVRETRLEQVDPNECRKEIPVLADPVAESQRHQHKESSDQAERTFNRIVILPIEFTATLRTPTSRSQQCSPVNEDALALLVFSSARGSKEGAAC